MAVKRNDREVRDLARDESRLLDDLLARFDEAWQDGLTPVLTDYLPTPESAIDREAAFAELVMIDLEYRWKKWRSGDSPTAKEQGALLPPYPLLEDYATACGLAALPEPWALTLIREEFRARRKWGNGPPVDEFVKRFPLLGEELTPVLLRLERELAAGADSVSAAVGQTVVSKDGSAASDDSASPPDDAALSPGAIVAGDYEVLRRLGRGGMGVVYLAKHLRMERLVAIKVVSPAISQDAEALRRFQREVKLAARLAHPNIVMAHDARQDGSLLAFVMEFVDGPDLGTLVETSGPLSVAVVVDYISQAARGLAYAHGKGVVHRDIKPHNLLVERATGAVKILDLGLAGFHAHGGPGELGSLPASANRFTKTGAIMGTVDYMAPEQALDAKRADERADLYSLGCVLFYLLTGNPLFGGDTQMKRLLAHRQDPPPKLRDARRDVPPDLESVFQRLVAKQPHNRYPSAESLLRDLAATGERPPSEPIARLSKPPAMPLTVRLPEENEEDLEQPADEIPASDRFARKSWHARGPDALAQAEEREAAAQFRRRLFLGSALVCVLVLTARLAVWLWRGLSR